MARIEKSIEVNAPLETVYNQWTQFEEFPRFMGGVRRVRQIDDKHLEWEAEIAGKEERWQAEITAQVPNSHIAWRSTSGAEHAGRIAFAPMGTGNTRLDLVLDYEPRGATEKIGSALGILSSRVQNDLEAFKDFIEARGRETGAWRGEIKGGQVTRESESAGAHKGLESPGMGGSTSTQRSSDPRRPGGTGPGHVL